LLNSHQSCLYAAAGAGTRAEMNDEQVEVALVFLLYPDTTSAAAPVLLQAWV
jgi:hypothetical protein